MTRALVLLCWMGTALTQENPAIDMPGYLRVAREAAEHRATRRVSEAEFIRTAIEQRAEAILPRRRGQWGTVTFDEPGLAHKVDDVLAEGFGEL